MAERDTKFSLGCMVEAPAVPRPWEAAGSRPQKLCLLLRGKALGQSTLLLFHVTGLSPSNRKDCVNQYLHPRVP